MSYSVKFNPPARVLGNDPVKFVVKQNQRQFGRVQIKKGGIVWIPKNRSTGILVSWKEFDEWMRGV